MHPNIEQAKAELIEALSNAVAPYIEQDNVTPASVMYTVESTLKQWLEAVVGVEDSCIVTAHWDPSTFGSMRIEVRLRWPPYAT